MPFYPVGNEGLMSVSVEQEKYFAAIVSATPSGLSVLVCYQVTVYK